MLPKGNSDGAPHASSSSITSRTFSTSRPSSNHSVLSPREISAWLPSKALQLLATAAARMKYGVGKCSLRPLQLLLSSAAAGVGGLLERLRTTGVVTACGLLERLRTTGVVTAVDAVPAEPTGIITSSSQALLMLSSLYAFTVAFSSCSALRWCNRASASFAPMLSSAFQPLASANSVSLSIQVNDAADAV